MVDRLHNAILFAIIIGVMGVAVGKGMAVPDRCMENSTSVGCSTPPTYLEPPP